jgi:hypothetical protein
MKVSHYVSHVKHFLTPKPQTERTEPSKTEQNSEEDTEEQDSIELSGS